MSDYFTIAVEHTLTWEGVDSEDELGGRTRYGIAQRYHPHVDVPNLTREGAIEIYRSEYWGGAMACAELPPAHAVFLFDFCVNPGSGHAIRALQKVVGVYMDGFVGEKTIAAALQCEPLSLLKALKVRRDYIYITRKYSERDGAGWLARSLDCYELCRPLIAASR